METQSPENTRETCSTDCAAVNIHLQLKIQATRCNATKTLRWWCISLCIYQATYSGRYSAPDQRGFDSLDERLRMLKMMFFEDKTQLVPPPDSGVYESLCKLICKHFQLLESSQQKKSDMTYHEWERGMIGYSPDGQNMFTLCAWNGKRSKYCVG